MSATTVNTESFLSNIATAKWDTQQITSDGNIVARSSKLSVWAGRNCSCFGSQKKNYDVALALFAAKEQMTAYMKPECTVDELELATRAGIVTAALKNLNALVERVNQKRPENKQLEKISFEVAPAAKPAAVANPNEVEEIDSSSATPDALTPPSTPAETTAPKRRSKEARMLEEGKAFVQNFRSKLKTTPKD